MKLKKILISLLTFSLIIPTYAFAAPSDPYDMYALEGQAYAGITDVTASSGSTSTEPEDVKAETPNEDTTKKEKEAQAEESASRDAEEKEKLKKDGYDVDELDKKTDALKKERTNTRDRGDIKSKQFSKNGALTPNILSGLAGNADKVFDISGSITSLPFDKLYGVTARSTTYLGEVPGGMKDFKDSEYPSMSDYRIDAQKRTWWSQPQKVSADLKWSKDSTNDVHALNLINAPTGFDVMGVFFSNTFCMLLMFINGLFIGVVGFFISIANFDVKGLMEILQWKELANLFKKLFIGDGFGSTSPVFIIALVAFMITIAGMVIRYFRKGNQAARELVNEFLILIAAIIIAGIGYSGSYDRLIEKTNTATIRFMQGLNNDMGASSELFTQKTDDAFADAAATQMALVNKITIDTIIRSQFGVPVSELTLYDSKKPEITAKNWGINAGEMKRLIGAITWDGNQDYITVHTGKSASNASDPNLGYFWYAVSSGTYHSDPFVQKSGKTYAVLGDRNGFLYGIDLLAGIDASAGGSSKVGQIISNFKAPHMDVASMFLCMLVSLALIGSISTVAIYCLFAKIIFNIGFVFVPVLVILLLVKPFRHIAQQAVVTWCVSFLKMLVAQVIIFIIIASTGIFCGYGNSGMMLSIIVLAVLSRFIPKLLVAINGAMGNISIGGVGQLAAARSLDNKFNRAANFISKSKSNSQNKEKRGKMRAEEKAARLSVLSNLGKGNLETSVTHDDIENQLNNFNQNNVTSMSPDNETMASTGGQGKQKNPHDLALQYLSGDNPDIGAVWHNQELMDSLSEDEQFAVRSTVSALQSEDYKKSQDFAMQQLDLLDPSKRFGAVKGMWDNSKFGNKVNEKAGKVGAKVAKTNVYQNYQAYKANMAEKQSQLKNKMSALANKNKFTRAVSKGSTFAGRGLTKLGKGAAKGAISYIGAQTGATALYELTRHSMAQRSLSKLNKTTDISQNAHTAKAMDQFKTFMKTHNSAVLERKEPKIEEIKTSQGTWKVVEGENLPSTSVENARAAVTRDQFSVVQPKSKPTPPKPTKPKSPTVKLHTQNNRRPQSPKPAPKPAAEPHTQNNSEAQPSKSTPVFQPPKERPKPTPQQYQSIPQQPKQTQPTNQQPKSKQKIKINSSPFKVIDGGKKD